MPQCWHKNLAGVVAFNTCHTSVNTHEHFPETEIYGPHLLGLQAAQESPSKINCQRTKDLDDKK